MSVSFDSNQIYLGMDPLGLCTSNSKPPSNHPLTGAELDTVPNSLSESSARIVSQNAMTQISDNVERARELLIEERKKRSISPGRAKQLADLDALLDRHGQLLKLQAQLSNSTNPSSTSSSTSSSQVSDLGSSSMSLSSSATKVDNMSSSSISTREVKQDTKTLNPPVGLKQQIQVAKSLLAKLSPASFYDDYCLETYLLSELKDDLIKLFQANVKLDKVSKCLELCSLINKADNLEKLFELVKLNNFDGLSKNKLNYLHLLAKQVSLHKVPVGKIKKLGEEESSIGEPTTEEKTKIIKNSFKLCLDLISLKFAIIKKLDSQDKVIIELYEKRLQQLKDSFEWGKAKKSNQAEFEQFVHFNPSFLSFKNDLSRDANKEKSLVDVSRMCDDIHVYYSLYLGMIKDSDYDVIFMTNTDHLFAEVKPIKPRPIDLTNLPAPDAPSPLDSPASERDEEIVLARLTTAMFPVDDIDTSQLENNVQEEREKLYRSELSSSFSKSVKCDEMVWSSTPKVVALVLHKALTKKIESSQFKDISKEERNAYILQFETARDHLNLGSRSFGLILRMIFENKWPLLGVLFNKLMLATYGPSEKLLNTKTKLSGKAWPTAHNLTNLSRDLKDHDQAPQERRDLFDTFSEANLWYRYPWTMEQRYARASTAIPQALKFNANWLNTLSMALRGSLIVDANLIKDCASLLEFVFAQQKALFTFIMSECDLGDEDRILLNDYFKFNEEIKKQLLEHIGAQQGKTMVFERMSPSLTQTDLMLQRVQTRLETCLQTLSTIDSKPAKKAHLELKDASVHIVLLRGALRLQSCASQDYLTSLHYHNALEGHWPLEKLSRAEAILFNIPTADFKGVHSLYTFNKLLAEQRIKIEMEKNGVDKDRAEGNVEQQVQKTVCCSFDRTYDARINFANRSSDKASHGINKLLDLIKEANKDLWIEEGTSRQNVPSKESAEKLIQRECGAFEAQLSFLEDAVKTFQR